MKRFWTWAIIAAAVALPVSVSAQTIPGCPAATVTTVSNATAEAIADLDTVSKDVALAGVPTFITGVKVTTSLTHMCEANLLITVTSPAGTTVTLSSNNGAGAGCPNAVEFFNGTTFNDDVDPLGAVPYTSNDLLVTDADYTAILGPIPTLVPEEPLSAFYGEDPNGTWNLTVVDGFLINSGNFTSWQLEVSSIPAAPTETSLAFAGPGGAVPDGASLVTNLAVPAAGLGTFITDVNLTTTLPHAASGDLQIALKSPTGTIATLTTNNGGANANVFNGTVWDDQADDPVTDHTYANGILASPLSPEEALSPFFGEAPAGTWQLTIADTAVTGTGSLTSWNLEITTSTCTAPTPTGPTPTIPGPAPTPTPTIPPTVCNGQHATIIGTTGNDLIIGTDTDDVIHSLAGNDIVRGKQGADTICGGRGNDTLRGNKDDDVVKGGGGDDQLFGGVDRDVLLGGKGNDALDGGDEEDTCIDNKGTNSKVSCEN